jgi:hypothetical protein
MHCHINLLIQIHDSMSRLLGCTPSSLICECTYLVWVLFICGLQIKIIQFILDPYAIAKYCTSYMKNKIKINNIIITLYHTKIYCKYIANIRIQKLGNVFFNDQQIIVQLVFYLVFFLSSYHSFQTFEFINTFPSE